MVRYVHMPLFFVLAGFLCHKQNIGKFYKKKILRILVPFFFFSILKLIYANLITNEFVHKDSFAMQLYDSFILGEGYWFAYAICIVYLVAPIFWIDEHTETVPMRAIIGVLFLFIFNTMYYGLHWHFLKIIFQFRNAVLYLPYFLCGYIIRIYFEPLKRMLASKKIWILIISTIIVALVAILEVKGVKGNTFVTKFLVSYALMVWLILFSSLLPHGINLLKLAGDYSWQVMLLDAFYKAILFAVISKFVNLSTFVVCAIVVMDYVLGIATCIVAKRVPVLRECMGLR